MYSNADHFILHVEEIARSDFRHRTLRLDAMVRGKPWPLVGERGKRNRRRLKAICRSWREDAQPHRFRDKHLGHDELASRVKRGTGDSGDLHLGIDQVLVSSGQILCRHGGEKLPAATTARQHPACLTISSHSLHDAFHHHPTTLRQTREELRVIVDRLGQWPPSENLDGSRQNVGGESALHNLSLDLDLIPNGDGRVVLWTLSTLEDSSSGRLNNIDPNAY